jgi:hypothetical protein
MVANYANMLDTFNQCNMEFFEGKLLFPQFDLLHSYRTCGYFQYTTGGWFDKTVYDPIIFMTDYYDFTERQFTDIMVHEMIHYYLAWNRVKTKKYHGKEFMEIAHDLNEKYGLNVTKTLDASSFKRTEQAPKTKGFWQWLLW